MIHPLAEKIEKDLRLGALRIFDDARLRYLDQEIRRWLEEKVGYFIKDGVPRVVTQEKVRELLELEDNKEWCEHLKHRYSGSACRDRWFLIQPSMPHAEAVADDFNYCPICSTKKP